MSRILIITVILTVGLTLTTSSLDRDSNAKQYPVSFSNTIDNTTFIDANNILMFVTNHGNFGRDLAGVFGNDYGTYYPYTSIADIQSGLEDNSVLFAAGLWVGGIVNSQTRVTVSEYSSEYVPGPMLGGTYQMDRPEFRVYKLYRDSLYSNPNQDYMEWPADQGAPVDNLDRPRMHGDQMTFSVFNDADPMEHDNNSGQTTPLGIEVQHTTWAYDQPGQDSIFINALIPVGGTAPGFAVQVRVVDPTQLTGHDYEVVIEPTTTRGSHDIEIDHVWHLDDITASQRVLADQPNFSGDINYPIVDGIQPVVTDTSNAIFESFEVVANANGPVSPPTPAAFAFRDFPTPNNMNPAASVQQTQPMVGLGWAIHTGDNGARPTYLDFIDRTLRGDPARLAQVGQNDFEIRFTGSYANPGAGGSYIYEWALDQSTYWVPFELWRTGIGTPEDPSDDVRLIPYAFGDGDGLFNITSWGTDPNCGSGGCEHSASSNNDDPYTGEWLYWRLPADSSPGTAGYDAYEQVMTTNPASYFDQSVPIMDRMVLVYWNGDLGGDGPPFDVDLPEQGTVFRIRTVKDRTETYAFSFTADDSTVVVSTVGGEANAVYMNYKVINKSGNTITNMYVSLWTDPDLGGAGDDLVGCDTVNEIWYCYNGSAIDIQYGTAIPAVGIKAVSVPTPWNSVNKYINGTDPNNFTESYNYMQGLNADGSPYMYNGQVTKFVHSGDPIAGMGDLDFDPSDRRLMSSYGPFTVAANDTIELEFKLAVGHASDRLGSIGKLKTILLDTADQCCTGIRGNANGDPGDVSDISDLTYLVEYMFKQGMAPACPAEADVTNSQLVDISDLTYLVQWFFGGGSAPAICPR